ncbi:MAG: methylenetetrahydrofolate reductase [Desulfobacterales bacterium]|nr:methylenetetrahydrofolate reductase [Desulfobacterales bacterium]
MRLTDLWKNNKQPTISFELFPARNASAAEKLEQSIDDLKALNPDFVSVTFGAGGSTREGSLQLIKKLQNEKNLNVVAYFAGYGLPPDDIISVMDSYKEAGIETILVVRGDEPHGQENFKPHPYSLKHASDLLLFIANKYNFCTGAAGYPEGHIEAESKDKDLEYLKLKVYNGAQFIISNYFYDNHFFFDFVLRCKKIGIDVPILPGVMPIYSLKMMKTLANLCGSTITEELNQKLSNLPENDKAALEEFGIEFATEQCRELIKTGVPGIHIYTMDRSNSAVEIIKKLRREKVL